MPVEIKEEDIILPSTGLGSNLDVTLAAVEAIQNETITRDFPAENTGRAVNPGNLFDWDTRTDDPRVSYEEAGIVDYVSEEKELLDAKSENQSWERYFRKNHPDLIPDEWEEWEETSNDFIDLISYMNSDLGEEMYQSLSKDAIGPYAPGEAPSVYDRIAEEQNLPVDNPLTEDIDEGLYMWDMQFDPFNSTQIDRIRHYYGSKQALEDLGLVGGVVTSQGHELLSSAGLIQTWMSDEDMTETLKDTEVNFLAMTDYLKEGDEFSATEFKQKLNEFDMTPKEFEKWGNYALNRIGYQTEYELAKSDPTYWDTLTDQEKYNLKTQDRNRLYSDVVLTALGNRGTTIPSPNQLIFTDNFRPNKDLVANNPKLKTEAINHLMPTILEQPIEAGLETVQNINPNNLRLIE